MFIHHNLAEQVLPQPVTDEETDALASLFSGQALSAASAESLFRDLVEGQLDEPAIAAMLVALRLKGETVDELIGAARALRAADSDFERPDYLFADSCGTGGDGSGSINISTAVAFVAAAAGLPVAKHGNRSFTSRCGSADVLERLGVKLDVSAQVSRLALDQTGICFLFAPLYHPGLRHAGPARRALKVRTIMNVLGPCVNPAEPPVQLLGVADARLLEPVARTLVALGTREALVVHGSGLDEVALHGETEAVQVRGGRLTRRTITPEEAGLSRSPVATVKGGDPDENAQRL
ncbi:MAG: anthranilate phosphoribosyltransferase, partial [Allosphingosinicella sp.]